MKSNEKSRGWNYTLYFVLHVHVQTNNLLTVNTSSRNEYDSNSSSMPNAGCASFIRFWNINNIEKERVSLDPTRHCSHRHQRKKIQQHRDPSLSVLDSCRGWKCTTRVPPTCLPSIQMPRTKYVRISCTLHTEQADKNSIKDFVKAKRSTSSVKFKYVSRSQFCRWKPVKSKKNVSLDHTRPCIHTQN